MTRVAASEHHLLTIARALVGEGAEAAEPFLRQGRELAPARGRGADANAGANAGVAPAEWRMGPTSMRLLKGTLAHGVVRLLARRGGWRPARFLGPDGKPSSGRLWERHPTPTFAFSGASFRLLRWLTATPFGLSQAPPLQTGGELTAADEVLHYVAAEMLARNGLGFALAPATAFARSGLCWLGFPEELRGRNGTGSGASPESGIEAAGDPPDPERFARLATGEGAIVLEAFQQELAARWVVLERNKRSCVRCDRMVDLGRTQETLLASFLEGLDRARRRDLAGFLVEAAAVLVPRPMPAAHWVASLDPRASLQERMAARRAAGAFLRALARLEAWNGEHRTTAFFDEGYDAAQMLLQEWERLGADGYRRVQALLHDLESLGDTKA